MSQKDSHDIVVFGAASSGKTVFLSAMFNKLYQPSKNTDFVLGLPIVQRRKLVQQYNALCDEGEWPDPNEANEFTEWNFSCSVKVRNNGHLETFTPLQFNYYDYAGELVTGGSLRSEDYIKRLEEKLANASAILMLLDGVLVFEHITGNEQHGHSLSGILRLACHDMAEFDVPVHFVITKWDVLHNNKISLKTVQEKLFENPDFIRFMNSRDKHKPTRLIPVSSTGMEFATLQKDRSMKTNDGIIPAPYNVECPISCVIYDHWISQLNDYQNELVIRQEELTDEVIITPNISWRQRLAAKIGDTVLVISKKLPKITDYQDIIAQNISTYLKRPKIDSEASAAEYEQQINAERLQSLAKVRCEESALNAILKSMEKVITILEYQFPESNLSGE